MALERPPGGGVIVVLGGLDAAHAVTADTARSATDAQTALNAVNAVNADTVNGHGAGCLPGTIPFAGACWQSSHNEFVATAPSAATSCAQKGGALPGALDLVAFVQASGIKIDAGNEWSSELSNFSVLTLTQQSRSPQQPS